MAERAAKLGGGSTIQPPKEEPPKKKYPWEQSSNPTISSNQKQGGE
jgi:hypothetical protein